MVKGLLLVGLGGALGSMGRYSVALLTKKLAPAAVFPWGTFAVNILGCFAIGCLAACFVQQETQSARLFFVVGILGGFTTFSAFGLETFQLIQSSHMVTAILYVSLSIAVGLLATILGYYLFS